MDKSFKKRIPPPGGRVGRVHIVLDGRFGGGACVSAYICGGLRSCKNIQTCRFCGVRIFLIDVAWRYLSAADKIGFWKWGIVDLISAIPFITVLRYGRIISAARIMLSARSSGKMDNNTLDRRRPKRAKSSRNRIIQKLFQIFPSNKILDILHP